MVKRGQVAIFVILAVILSASIILLFSISKNTNKVEKTETSPHSDFVGDIILRMGDECIKKVASQGGHYISSGSLIMWFDSGAVSIPSLESIASEIEICMDEILKRDSIALLQETFNDETFELKKNEIKSKVSILPGNVLLNVKFPLIVSYGDAVASFSDFNEESNLDIYRAYNLATNVINSAALSEFDMCKPNEALSQEGVSFSVTGDNEIEVEVSLSESLSDDNGQLKFSMKRPLRLSFGNEKKKMAVLYQDTKDWPTFGGKSVSVLKDEIDLVDGVDYYNCADSYNMENFFNSVDNYALVVVTGNLQWQFVLTPEEEGILLAGCNSFNKRARKSILKNWINQGGVLWINYLDKFESDDFVISYLGSLGYSGGYWVISSSIFSAPQDALEDLRKNRKVVEAGDIAEKNHDILNCPYKISDEIAGTAATAPLIVGDEEEVIIGNKERAILWLRPLGEGFIVLDQFYLKDNLFEQLEFNDDIYSRGLGKKYFTNVLHFIAKSDAYKKAQQRIFLVSPSEGSEVSLPIFSFKSELGASIDYIIYFSDKSGKTSSVQLGGSLTTPSANEFQIDLSGKDEWTNLEIGEYEWQIIGREGDKDYFSNIFYFNKI